MIYEEKQAITENGKKFKAPLLAKAFIHSYIKKVDGNSMQERSWIMEFWYNGNSAWSRLISWEPKVLQSQKKIYKPFSAKKGISSFSFESMEGRKKSMTFLFGDVVRR